jgi:hypothetical protein
MFLPEPSSDPVLLGTTDKDRRFFAFSTGKTGSDNNTTTKRVKSRA